MVENPSGEIVESDRPCCITGSHRCEVVATKAREGHPLRNVMCADSGMVFVDPLPIEDLSKFYKEDYRLSYKNAYVPKAKHIVRAGRVAMSRFGHAKGAIQPGMRCLDIGAGGGEWVYLLASMGCDSVGVEPNQGYGSFSREYYGVEVFLGMYQEASFERESYDALSLFQVLEHLADPVEDLRRMSGFLKTGGLFLIEVPDILYSKMHFDHKWHDGHLYGFDWLTLEAVAAKAGLKRVRLDVNPGNLFAVFEKSGENEVPGPDLEGHFEEAKQQLFGGRNEYWKDSATYTKVFRKLRNNIREKSIAGKCGSPKKILDYQYLPFVKSLTGSKTDIAK